MKTNYSKNIVFHADSQISDTINTNKNLTENSLRMRVMAYLAQVKANLLTETIYELNHDKQIISHDAQLLKEKNIQLQEQKQIIEEQNKQLQKQVALEKELNAHKEKLWIEQAKMASLGEMIGNIAHQWRQPLSVISTIATGMKIKHEYNTLSSDELLKNLDAIDEQSQYLSQTIDDFRDFIKERKVIQEVSIIDKINQTLKIVSTTLKNHHIKLINQLDYDQDIRLALIPGEFSQVIINIINNSKDALLENKISNPWIKLELKSFDHMIQITLEDNAGGIPKEIIPKIFDAYFTTKPEDQGTGLGLHMSYKIIIESLDGKLYVQNSENGAKFFIELPLN